MKVLHLRTGCRLHFGLMELAAEEPLRYAGLGLMLDHPGFELSFAAADSAAADSQTIDKQADSSSIAIGPTIDVSGVKLPDETNRSDSAELKLEFLRRMAAVAEQQAVVARSMSAEQVPACHIRLIRALPMHSGLGAGTQLAAAVATGLELFARGARSSHSAAISETGTAASDISAPLSAQVANDERWCSVLDAQPPLSTQWLAQTAGRGLRSAIGLFGFLHGGLILDRGYAVNSAQDTNSKVATGDHGVRPLAVQNARAASAWRVVLIVPQHRQAVSGAKESEWMDELGSLPNPHRNDMLALAQEAFTLATHHDRFVDFTHCLDQYMEQAGQLFSRYQGGLYNGKDVAKAVECARRIGLRGVGQSSWGPTVFGFAANQATAQHYAAQLSDLRPDWRVRVAATTARGAEYRWQ